MEAEVSEWPCDRNDCGNSTARSPSVLPLALTEDLNLGNGLRALCDDCASRWCFGPACTQEGADGSSGVGYRLLTQEQADKWGIDFDYVRNRSLFLPRISVCGSCRMWKANQDRNARTTATIKAYECPVSGCERSDPL